MNAIEDEYMKEIAEDQKWFEEDELYYAQPEILQLVEEGDLSALNNYLRRIGGF